MGLFGYLTNCKVLKIKYLNQFKKVLNKTAICLKLKPIVHKFDFYFTFGFPNFVKHKIIKYLAVS